MCDCLVKDSANYLDHINGKKRMKILYIHIYILFIYSFYFTFAIYCLLFIFIYLFILFDIFCCYYLFVLVSFIYLFYFNYVDQRAMGLSMRTERATVEDVRDR